MKQEFTDLLPFQSHKDLHSIGAGQPFRGRRIPFSETITAHFAIPWDGFIMDKLAISIPKSGPLCAGSHLIIGEYRAHVGDRILKNSGRCEFVEVRTVECELKVTKYCPRIRRHLTFKQNFDGKRDEWRGCDGRCVGGGGCVGDGWRKCDGG